MRSFCDMCKGQDTILSQTKEQLYKKFPHPQILRIGSTSTSSNKSRPQTGPGRTRSQPSDRFLGLASVSCRVAVIGLDGEEFASREDGTWRFAQRKAVGGGTMGGGSEANSTQYIHCLKSWNWNKNNLVIRNWGHCSIPVTTIISQR